MAIGLARSAIQKVTEHGAPGAILPPGTVFDFRPLEQQADPHQDPTHGVLVVTDDQNIIDVPLGNSWEDEPGAVRRGAWAEATGMAPATDARSIREMFMDHITRSDANGQTSSRPAAFRHNGELSVPAFLGGRKAFNRDPRKGRYLDGASQAQALLARADVLATYQENPEVARKMLLTFCGQFDLNPANPKHRMIVKRIVLPAALHDNKSYDPLPYETTVADEFNDNSFTGWTVLEGSTPTEAGSSYLTPSDTGALNLRLDSDLSTSNMLATAEILTFSLNPANQNYLGVSARVSSSATTHYNGLLIYDSTALMGGRITKRIAGALTTFAHTTAGFSATSADGRVCMLADGSDIQAYHLSADESFGFFDWTIFDTSISTGTRVGVVVRQNTSSTVRINRVQGDDYTPPSGNTYPLNHPGMTGGMRG